MKEYKLWKKQRELVEVLATFGISEEDIKYLPEALKIVKDIKNQPTQPTGFSPEVKEQIEKNKKALEKSKPIQPADYVSQFAGEQQEFYPYGRSKTSTNN